MASDTSPQRQTGPSLQPQAGPSSQRQGGPSLQCQAGASSPPQGRPSLQHQAGLSSQPQVGPSLQPQAELFLQSQHPHNVRQHSQTPRNMITEPRGVLHSIKQIRKNKLSGMGKTTLLVGVT